MGLTCRSRRARRQLDRPPIHHRHGVGGLIQAGAVGKLAIMHAARDDMEVLLGRAGIKGKDIALAITEDRHRSGSGEQRLGRNGGGYPALRFLVRQVTCVMRRGATPLARPYLPTQKSKTAAIVGIHGQQRMQQHAVVIALADFAEPAPALRRGVEVDLAGVLDRQHMAALYRGNRAVAPAFDDPLRRHLVVAEKAVEPHLQRTITPGKPPQADRLARNHAFDERRPPLSRRRSPNRPNVQSIRNNTRHPRPTWSVAIEITRIADSGIPCLHPESIRRTKYVHALVRKQGPITTRSGLGHGG
ncbi:hypothetical protein ABIF00_001068 [Bradyrhizobium elkanii]